MDRRKLASGLVLALTAVWILASLVTLAGPNDLFLDSDWAVATGATFAVIVLSIIGYMALGTPWGRWRRTAYW